MSAPKSVTKIDKAGRVTYTSNVDAANYYLFELSRAAMRDVGKYVSKKFKIAFYEHFTKRSGDGGKACRYKVLASKSTKYPRVHIGLLTGKQDGFYAFFQELGTKSGNVPKLGLLTGIVQNNVAEIVKIESQYLSGLSDEASRLAAMIDEGDMEGGADED